VESCSCLRSSRPTSRPRATAGRAMSVASQRFTFANSLISIF